MDLDLELQMEQEMQGMQEQAQLEQQQEQPPSSRSASSAYTVPLDVASLVWRAMRPAGPARPASLLYANDSWIEPNGARAIAKAIAKSAVEAAASCQAARSAWRLVCRDFSAAMLPDLSSLAYQGAMSDGVTLCSLLTKLGRCRRPGSPPHLRRLDLGEDDAGPTLRAPEARAALGALQALRVVVFQAAAVKQQLRVGDVAQLLRLCPGLLEFELERRDLSGNALEVASVLQDAPSLQHLQRLRLHDMTMGAPQLAELQDLLQTRLTALVELDLHGMNDIDSVSPGGVAEAALAHGRLVQLRLSYWYCYGNIECTELANALGGEHSCSLTVLDLDGLELYSPDALQLLRGNTHLKELGLQCEYMVADGDREQLSSSLAALTGLSELRLRLIDDDAAHVARAVVGATGLRALSYRTFEDMGGLMEGVGELAAALRGLALLEELRVGVMVFDSGSSLAQLLRLPALRRLDVEVKLVRATPHDAAELAAALASLVELEYASVVLHFGDSCLSASEFEDVIAAAAAIAALPAAEYDRQNHGGIVLRLAAAVAHAVPTMRRLRHLDVKIWSEDDIDKLVCQDAAGLIAAAATLAPELRHCSVDVQGFEPANRLAKAAALPSSPA